MDGTPDEEDAFEAWTACKMANASLRSYCYIMPVIWFCTSQQGRSPKRNEMHGNSLQHASKADSAGDGIRNLHVCPLRPYGPK